MLRARLALTRHDRIALCAVFFGWLKLVWVTSNNQQDRARSTVFAALGPPSTSGEEKKVALLRKDCPFEAE